MGDEVQGTVSTTKLLDFTAYINFKNLLSMAELQLHKFAEKGKLSSQPRVVIPWHASLGESET